MKRRLAHALFLSTALICGPVAASAAETGLAGPYLAARSASIASDFEAAARYYTYAMARDPGNVGLLDNAMLAFVGTGNIKGAARSALTFEKKGGTNQIADLVLKAHAIALDDFSRTMAEVGDVEGLTPLTYGLLRGWALLGRGQMSLAIEAFDDVAATADFTSFARYHHALAVASVGDFESADAILSGERFGPLQLTPRGLLAHAQILAQLERYEDALALVEPIRGMRFDASLDLLVERLEAGAPIQFDLIRNAKDGSAEVYFNIAAILNGRAAPEHVLTYARLAAHIRPDHAPALLTAAETLETMQQFGLATKAFAAVPTDDPNYFVAELGRADALFADGREDASVEVLRALAKTHGDMPLVHASLGDTLGRMHQDQEAIEAYDQALGLQDNDARGLWRIYYARGIVHERIDNFERMEADFRKALELQPNQPDVLNYLGYSLVEQRTKMDEALEMIKVAVAEQPESGYITDSLGWVYYRLGRYDEAVAPMEKAVELLPVDPIVNDHLGDVYWKVGRYREAEFQWKRALSFEPEEEEADRIRLKLQIGLDLVLDQEAERSETQTAND